MQLYIIGPRKSNSQRAAHYEAKTFLRSENHRSTFLDEHVNFDPKGLDLPPNYLICKALEHALECEGLYLLKGWKTDDISCILHNAFDQLGKRIFYQISNASPAACSTDITQHPIAIHN